MKTLVVILTVSAFLQSTILNIDLVLLILICRAYIKPEKANLYLGFGFGLLVSHLGLTPLGLQSLLYIIFIQATESLSKIRLAGNPLLVLPISFIFLLLNLYINSFFSNIFFESSYVVVSSLVSLPLFYALRLWEERFIVQKDIKLRV